MWYLAGVIEEQFSGVLIRYYGYESHWDETVDIERYQRLIGLALVEWEGDWYLAGIIRIENNEYFIRYHEYDSSWDEWTPVSRIKIQ